MPPRRRTFYLADATALSNGKVRRLIRLHPDDWLAAWGAFHVLIGVATLNGSPRLSDADVTDTLGTDHDHLAAVLRGVGLLTRNGVDPSTYKDWCPKPRPKYPSDSGGIKPTPPESRPIPMESPTSSTTSPSSTATPSPRNGSSGFPPIGSRSVA